MAVIGSAYVTIRAQTDQLRRDIDKGLSGASFNPPKISFNGRSFERDAGDSARRASNNFDDELSRGLSRAIGNAESEAGSGGGRIGNSFSAGIDRSGADGRLKSLIFRIAALTPVIAAGVAAASSLAAGIFSIGSAAAAAIPALAVLPASIAALAQAGGTLGLAFGGIGAALKAGNKAAVASGGGAKIASSAQENAAKRIKKAQQGISDAVKQNAEAVEQANRKVRDAQEHLGEVYERVAETMKKAQRGVADAQQALNDAFEKGAESQLNAQRDVEKALRDVNDAQKDSVKAQLEVNQARKDAVKYLRDLRDNLQGAVIDEGEAQLALERAKGHLDEVSELPVNNNLRREAQLAYDQAVLNLKNAGDAVSDLQEETDKANKTGVEGTDEVIAAREKAAEAAQKLVDAQQSLSDAYVNQNKAQRDSQRDIADAQRDLADARDELAKTEKDNARDIRDAQEGLTDALKEQGKVGEENARRLADAQDALAEATDSAATAAQGGTKAFNAFNTAMSKLSPAARDFVKYLLSINYVLKNLRAEAGAELFPKLTDALKTVIASGIVEDLGKGLRDTGSAIGDVAKNVASLSTDPFFRGNFNTILSGNVVTIGLMGTAFRNVIDLIATLLAQAQPLTQRFAGFVATFTGNWAGNARKNAEQIGDAFNKAGDVAAQLGRIIENIALAVFHLGQIARPSGQTLLDSFEKATAKLNEMISDPGNRDGLTKYFDGVAANVRALGDLFNQISLAFAKAGDNPSVAKTADALRTQVVPALQELGGSAQDLGPKIADLLASALQAFNDLSGSPAIEVAISILKGFFEAVSVIATTPVLREAAFAVLTFMAAMKALSLINSFTGISNLGNQMKSAKKGFEAAAASAVKYKNTLLGVNNAPGPAAGVGGKLDAAKLRVMYGVDKLKSVGKQAGTAFASGLSATGGAIKTAASKVTSGASAAMSKGLNAASKAGGAFAKAASAAARSARLLGAGLYTALGPIGLIALAVAALVAVFVILYKKNETFRNIVNSVWASVQKAISAAWDIMKPIFAQIADAFNKYIIPAIQLYGKLWEFYFKVVITVIQIAWGVISTIFNAIVAFITNILIPAVQAFFDGWQLVFNTAQKIVQDAVSIILSVLQGIIDFAVNLFQAIYEPIRAAFEIYFNVVQDVIKRVKDVLNTIIGFIVDLGKAIANAGSNIWNFLFQKAEDAKNGAINIVNGLIGFIAGLGGRLAGAAGNLFGFLGTKAIEAKDFVVTKLGEVVGGILGIKDTLASRASDMWDSVLNSFRGMLNRLISLWNNLEFTLPSVDVPFFGKVGGFTLSTPNIQPLAKGGEVDKATLAVIGEAGNERVTPLDSDGYSKGERALISALNTGKIGSGTNVNITIVQQPGQSMQELAKAVSREIAWSGV